jgi:opacity protein-like surface antigen
MKISPAAILLALVMAPASAFAADLGIPQSAVSETAVALGTGWDIRGDIGYDMEDPIKLNTDQSALLVGAPFTPNPASMVPSSQWKSNFNAAVGFGYKFTDNIRADLTFQTPGVLSSKMSTPLPIYCAYPTSQVPGVGYYNNPADTCSSMADLSQRNYTFLANAYYDVGTWFDITPYVGAGAGVNIATTTGSLTATPLNPMAPVAAAPNLWLTNIGTVGAPVYTPSNPQPKVGFPGQGQNQKISVTKSNFAFALMAGFGIELTQNATLEIGYQYLNVGNNTIAINNYLGQTIKQNGASQSVHVGIRYLID